MRDQLYSSMRFKGDGVTTKVALTFPLEHGENLEVKFGRDIQDEGYVIDYDVSPVLVTFSKALPKGVNIVIRRNTVASSVPYVFQDTGNARGGAEFNAKNIDDNFEHMSKVVIEIDETADRVIDSMEELEDKFDGVLVDFEEVRKVAEGADAKAESAIKTANRADTKADGAVATATQALGIANNADAKADQAIGVSDDATRIANEAKVQATNAEENSEEAVMIAESASESAGIALNQSNTAVADAKHAVEVAEGIDGKATEALTKSEEAKVEASAATVTANEAKGIADGVDTKADQAIATANSAEVLAQEAMDKVQEGGITEPELISKSVGEGKWMREGAYGVGGLKSLPNTTPSLCQPSGFYYSANTSPVAGSFFIDLKHSDSQAGFRISNAHYSDKFYMSAGDSRGAPLSFRPSCLLLHDRNTYPDSNGVLHNTKTPIDTLNTSDMADTVVDNDLLTVTSGAVHRALEGKRDLDDNVFNGLMTIKSDNDEQGSGILLQESDGTVRGQVVATDQGLQLTQYPAEGGLQTFTFPSEGGEVWAKQETVGEGKVVRESELAAKMDTSLITDIVTNGRNTVPSNNAVLTALDKGIVVPSEEYPIDLTSKLYNIIDFYGGATPFTDSLNRDITYKGNSELDLLNLGYGLVSAQSNFTLPYPLVDKSKPTQTISMTFYVKTSTEPKQALVLQQLGEGRLDITLEGYATVDKAGVGGVFINNTWNLFKYPLDTSFNITLYFDIHGVLEVYVNYVRAFSVPDTIRPSGSSSNLLLQSRFNTYTYLQEIREVNTTNNKDVLRSLFARLGNKFGTSNFSISVSNSALLFSPTVMAVDDLGNIVYAINEDLVISPASLVKVLTCLLALDILDIDQTLTVIQEDIRQDTLLEAGDTISVLDAVKSAMLLSSNTSATLLARSAGIKLGGGLSTFLDFMNNSAVSLGMHSTQFVNANGIYNPNQMTTVKDMCLMGLAAKRSPLLTSVMSLKEADIKVSGAVKAISNTVANLGISGIVSGKTGTISSPSVGTYNLLNLVVHETRGYVICCLNAPSTVSRFNVNNLVSKSLGEALNMF